MKRLWALPVFIVLAAIQPNICTAEQKMQIKLNPPALKEGNLATLLEKRYSCRNFRDKPLEISDIASILWAACGKKHDAATHATRTAPSAGATYPLELYLVVGREISGKLKPGIYHYLIDSHSLELSRQGDIRKDLAGACLGQDFILRAPVSLVIAAKFQRTTGRYGNRAERYVYMEAGHAAQNTYLAVTCLGLATVEVGAFNDKEVREVLRLDNDSIPLVVLPIGYPQKI